MGALVSLDQREEVRKAIQSLRASAELVYGDPDRAGNPDLVDADGERGAFLGPVLLRADAAAVEPHDVEAFGPVSTVIGYDSLDEAIALAARGKGSLAGSLVTHDPEVARDGHARPRPVARPDPGPRPRRRRRVHRPRRTPADARARRSRPGRRRRGDGRPPRRPAPDAAHRPAGLARHAHRDHRPLDQGLGAHATTACTRSARAWPSCAIGDTIASEPRRVTLADIDHFAEFTGDTFYAHTDEEAARRTRCSAGSSRTATWSSRWPPGSSSTPTPGRCSPTSASTTCASSPRSRPTTRSRSR